MLFFIKGDNMEITINTQSSIKLKDNIIIYFDPYLIKEQTNDADYIFITHDHYDHLDLPSINNILKDTTKIIIPSSITNSLIDLNNELILVEPNDNITVDDINIKTIKSYNINKPYHPKDKNYLGYIITYNNKTYYIMGDTDIVPEIDNIKCDVLFIPIGGKFTCDYQEAAEYVNKIKPSIVIPIHYGTIVGDISLGESFKELIDKDIEVILKLGE